MTRRRVLLLFGGTSSEHEVSVVSGQGVAAALDPSRVEVIAVGIAKSGAWVRVAAVDALPSSPGLLPHVGEEDGEPAFLRRDGENVILVTPQTEELIDVVFPVLHGPGGEDGRIQGFLETLGVPYVGAGVAASALGMAKHLCKPLFERAGVEVTPWVTVTATQATRDLDGVVEMVLARFALPVFVKPSAQGSSMGVSKARTPAELAKAIDVATSFDGIALVEEAIAGREIEVAILGGAEPRASVPGEVVPCNEFYDYEAKYLVDGSELIIPADLPETVAERVRAAACAAFLAIGCEGLARVDFFVDGDRILCNEINTMPGFTPISMYPKLWEASGITYPDLLQELLELAVTRRG